jgi:hypothetical protein
MRRHGLHSLVVPVFCCLACASVTVQRLEPATPRKTNVDEIAILTAFPSSYRALGRIEVRDRGLRRSEAQLRRKLLAAAADLGAEAVVLEATTTRRAVGGFWNPFLLYDDPVVAGVAIVSHDDSPAASDPPERGAAEPPAAQPPSIP